MRGAKITFTFESGCRRVKSRTGKFTHELLVVSIESKCGPPSTQGFVNACQLQATDSSVNETAELHVLQTGSAISTEAGSQPVSTGTDLKSIMIPNVICQ